MQQHRNIIVDLRRRIVSGEFAPGESLPRRNELLAYYQTSNMTVQRAINHLASEGFIESRGSKGLFTTANPPNISHFALVLPPNYADAEINSDTQWNSLEKAVKEISTANAELKFKTYCIDGDADSSQQEFQRLLTDLKDGLLAGVTVYTQLNIALQQQLAPYPIVQIDPKFSDIIPGHVFFFDYAELTRMAIKRLKSRGATKLAVLLAARTNAIVSAAIEQVMRSSDITFYPEWIHGIHHLYQGVHWTSRIVRLLCMSGMSETPDGIIVLNENLLPYVVNTLGEIDRCPGAGMRVISHCNLPLVRPLYEQVDYIAFNSSQLLQQSLDALQQDKPAGCIVHEIAPELVTS